MKHCRIYYPCTEGHDVYYVYKVYRDNVMTKNERGLSIYKQRRVLDCVFYSLKDAERYCTKFNLNDD